MNRDPLPNPFPVSYSRIEVDGLNVFVRRAGDPARPAFVLLHGFPSSSHMFRDLIPLLAAHFHVIAPDYIGFGHSDAPPNDQFEYRFERLTDIVERLLEQLGIDRYHLYLHDFGGPVGLRLAVRQPGRVLGLVIQNTNAYLEGVSQAAADVFMPLWQRGDDTGARGLLRAETTKFQYTQGARDPAALNPDAWTHDQALLDRPGSAERQLALLTDYQTNVAAYDTWQAYFRAHRPKTLITWGRGDPFFTVAGAEAFRRDLPDARLVWLDGGHFALEENAGLVAGEIIDTFAGT
ncbi:MAG: alpha/beta hydrolase [Piscinibacter sp.]|nr:alpha/beta hydrolase [Piscinibacter sp.]